MSQVPLTRMTKVKGKKEPLNVKFFLKKSQLNVWSDECGKLTVFFCLILCQYKNKTVPSNVPNSSRICKHQTLKLVFTLFAIFCF